MIDSILKLTPIVGLVIAYMGLDTWKRQIKGTDKYKVASDLLLETFRLREGIQIVRTPLIEYAPIENKENSEEMNNFLGYVGVLERRWKEVQGPAANFSLAAFKAEVHLGKDVKKAADELLKAVRELQISYQMHIDMKRPGSGFEDDEFNKENRKTLFSKPTNDEFFKKVQKSIEKIEDLTYKYLK